MLFCTYEFDFYIYFYFYVLFKFFHHKKLVWENLAYCHFYSFFQLNNNVKALQLATLPHQPATCNLRRIFSYIAFMYACVWACRYGNVAFTLIPKWIKFQRITVSE